MSDTLPRLSSDQICVFIENHLDYGACRLEKLTVLGIDLVLDDTESLSHMLNRVDSLECDNRLRAWTGNDGFQWMLMNTW